MKDVSNAVAYALLIPKLMKAGREVGYSIAVHGSMARDLDVVAIPWTEEAVSAERVVMHLTVAVNGRLRNSGRKKPDSDEWETVHGSAPAEKPHGRLGWVIYIGDDGLYIDISVMPRVTSPSSSPDTEGSNAP